MDSTYLSTKFHSKFGQSILALKLVWPTTNTADWKSVHFVFTYFLLGNLVGDLSDRSEAWMFHWCTQKLTMDIRQKGMLNQFTKIKQMEKYYYI